jgi:tight adherence protein B
MQLSTGVLIAVVSALTGLATALLTGLCAPLWDRFAARQFRELGVRYEQLGLDADRLQTWLRAWGAALLLILAAGGVCHCWPLALVGAWLGYLAPGLLLHAAIRRREKQLRDQLVAAAQGLANAAKAGLSLAQGLETVCAETPAPLQREFRRIVFEYQRGRPLREAIDEVRRRLELDSFSLFAIAVQVALQRGGRISTALERISGSLHETQRLERKLDADTSSGRQMLLILSVFPAVFLTIFAVIAPHSVALLFDTLPGQLVLAAVVVVTYLGIRWARRIMSIPL